MTVMDATSALEVQGLSVRFGGVTALADVSLTAQVGQMVGIIGPNGAGKTTLFDALSGLCRPSGGSIHFDGLDITNRSAVWRARNGMRRTFQRQQVFGRLTVEENLLTACEWESGGGGMVADLVRFPTRTAREKKRRVRAAEVVELCGLTSARSRPAGLLPIGAARRLELGRALIDNPRLLLLDEPTSGLDTAEVEILRKVLAHLHSFTNCAVLLVEHDINFVMAQAQVVYVLVTGSVLAYGTPEQVRDHADVRTAYLGDHDASR